MSSDEGRRVGRRPRRKSRMPKTAFTAFVEYHIFFYLMSGPNREMSMGVRTAVNRLVSVDDEAEKMMERAEQIVNQVREQLGGEADQTEVLNYVKDHLYEILS